MKKPSWIALKRELEAVHAAQQEASRVERAANDAALRAERAQKEQKEALRIQRFMRWMQRARRVPFRAGDDWQALVFEGPYTTAWGDGLEGPTPVGYSFSPPFGAAEVAWDECGSLHGTPWGRFVVYTQRPERGERRAALADLRNGLISPWRFPSSYEAPLGPYLRQRDAEIRAWAIATLEAEIQREDARIAALEHALQHEVDALALLALEADDG